MSTPISASQVKELRDKTGAGMMDAKKALEECGGNMEKAMETLRQKGIASADKKSGRTAAEGLIMAKVSPDGKRGVLIEVNCETDFVARGDAFQGMANQLLDAALISSAPNASAFLKETIEGHTVDDFIKEKVGVIKENLGLSRLTRFERTSPGSIQSYIHLGSKIGVLLDIETGDDKALSSEDYKQLTKDITLHIASCAPEFTRRDEISADYIESERRIEMGRADLQSKPEEIRAKIVNGRIDKLLAERVLLEQPFVKDPGKTIQELLAEKSSALGTTIGITQFVRFMLGENADKSAEEQQQAVSV